MSETTSPVAKKARKSIDVCAPNDERVGRAARMMLSNPAYSVPQAIALQQRVRRLHSKLEKSASGVVADVKDVKPAAVVTATASKDFAPHIPLGLKACDFLTKSTDPFLAVQTCTDALDAAGFIKLSKRNPFAGVLKPGGSYYYTVNRSTLVAFTVGQKFKGGNGFKIIGGHTDSPHLKVKPISKRSGSGCVQLGVECYGGGLWHTWFDRDLGVSGRVFVRRTDPETGKEKVEQRMTAEERGALKINKEEHLSPILGTQGLLEAGAKAQLNQFDDDDWRKAQEPSLMKLIASELGIEVKQIANFELGLFDIQPASLGGIENEFLNSARLDNLATCFVALESILEYSKSEDLVNDDMISLIALFDHEEIGSQSTHGAGSPVMAEAVKRITSAFCDVVNVEAHSSAVRKSFVLSVDQAHAVHPNYASKHERTHGPKMNAGVVIKTNQNQRYATNGVTGFIAREIGRKSNTSLQEFVVRSDCPCGTTIGPIISSNTGIRTVDLGMPQLSMHSCREVMGIADLTYGLSVFRSFFKHFNEIDESLEG
eukprot:scaffold6802_cov144-Skeletonema_menzelii.AAC.6